MLILTRRVQQRIRIGSDVIVTILDVKGSQVRVGIEAPRVIEVHREEAVPLDEPVASSASRGEAPSSIDYPGSRNVRS